MPWSGVRVLTNNEHAHVGEWLVKRPQHGVLVWQNRVTRRALSTDNREQLVKNILHRLQRDRPICRDCTSLSKGAKIPGRTSGVWLALVLH